ncbi:MAG: COP23 domain-containing protein [Cyanobacteria bacterium P01_A01_bin.114]
MATPTRSYPIRSTAWRAGTWLLGSALLLLPLSGHAQTTGEGTPAPTEESETSDPVDSLPDDARFECQVYERQFTVMYTPESQPDQAYPWAVPGDMGGGWSAERRCYEISDRLERYRPEGLSELSTSIENGYNIVCARTDQNPSLCQIILTVPPGQDAVVTRDRVFENLTLADGGVSTTGVNTFTESGSIDILGQISEVLGGNLPSDSLGSTLGFGRGDINLKPYLAPSDGGTGEYLRGQGVTPGRRLNPENFR